MKKSTDANLILESAGLRATQGRSAIVACLLRSHSPLTQDQIASRLGRQGLNKVTIYRALESFVAAGLIHKVYIQDHSCRYELAHNCTAIQCHPHFTCTACGKTLCMTSAAVPLATGIDKGFTIRRQTVQLEGLCPACKKKT